MSLKKNFCPQWVKYVMLHYIYLYLNSWFLFLLFIIHNFVFCPFCSIIEGNHTFYNVSRLTRQKRVTKSKIYPIQSDTSQKLTKFRLKHYLNRINRFQSCKCRFEIWIKWGPIQTQNGTLDVIYVVKCFLHDQIGTVILFKSPFCMIFQIWKCIICLTLERIFIHQIICLGGSCNWVEPNWRLLVKRRHCFRDSQW